MNTMEHGNEKKKETPAAAAAAPAGQEVGVFLGMTHSQLAVAGVSLVGKGIKMYTVFTLARHWVER